MAVAPNPEDNGDSRIVSSVDGDGRDQEYVIADITEDGAWLSMDAGDAPDLSSWR
ncbi:hypothetical protein K0C01_04635 [Salinarchaeum sp. IM2453]|uniref:DUF7556 family protein n=1 Tax=Salinarchaeum sp. IM2453 TaxID=2862870 RepID=UPI001C82A62B|nr:hypothetical protein [Salinarchaeum sp. IM2453]QZA89840.1 hypothetical protein K0C01_04635 [Salinarchaeum sp. IM2453]